MTWGMMYVLHGLAGVGLIALIMVHVYFGIRPEKLPITKSMIFGYMSRDFYLEEHDHLTRAVAAMRGLERSCAESIVQEKLAAPDKSRVDKYEAFFAVLKRDAESALAAMELVLAQPRIGAQLIDNLNASIHLRALLADLFLVTEILDVRQK
jgi:hypothetical protein